jgi:hypothetical protein
MWFSKFAASATAWKTAVSIHSHKIKFSISTAYAITTLGELSFFHGAENSKL